MKTQIANGYVRVSTKDQAINGTSLISQNEFIEQYAKMNGLVLESILSDEGVSASSTKRPAFNAIMQLVKEKKTSAIIVYSISRFARNTRQLLEAVDIMKKNNIRFVSCKESIDTSTAIGQFFLTLVGSLAELESSQTGERIKDVKKNNKSSNRTYSAPIYGFDNNKKDHILVVNDEMKTVKTILELYKEKKSFGWIATKLNTENIPTKNAGKWHRSTVRNICNNSVYASVHNIVNNY